MPLFLVSFTKPERGLIDNLTRRSLIDNLTKRSRLDYLTKRSLIDNLKTFKIIKMCKIARNEMQSFILYSNNQIPMSLLSVSITSGHIESQKYNESILTASKRFKRQKQSKMVAKKVLK